MSVELFSGYFDGAPVIKVGGDWGLGIYCVYIVYIAGSWTAVSDRPRIRTCSHHFPWSWGEPIFSVIAEVFSLPTALYVCVCVGVCRRG